jgi:soluble lytic murein transglycosylase-like protein
MNPVEHVAHIVDDVSRQDSIEASQLALLPFQQEIDSVAARYALPAALIAAIVQEESRFQEFAARQEPSYLRNRRVQREANVWSAAHGGLPTALTELVDRSRSFGLMQIMGQTAREQQYDARYLASLYQVGRGLGEGARYFKRLLVAYRNDTLSAISAYNQGSAKKRRNVFVNARYVYRVVVAWRAYETFYRGRSLPDGLRVRRAR